MGNSDILRNKISLSTLNERIIPGNTKKEVEVVSSKLGYIGWAIDLDAGTDEPAWLIHRVITVGGLTTTEVAGVGQYSQIWDDRESYFDAPVFPNNKSLLFDGVDEYVTFGDNYTFGPATAFSWSFWFKANNLSAQRCFISKATADSNVYGYGFYHNSSGQLFCQLRSSGAKRNITFPTVLVAAQWYNIVFTFNGGSNVSGFNAYINGVKETTPAAASLTAWTVPDPLQFGRRGSSFHYAGNLNELAVWNRELTQADIDIIAAGPSDLNVSPIDNGLQSYWPFNDDSNFPVELDAADSVSGTLVNMEVADYVTDVP